MPNSVMRIFLSSFTRSMKRRLRKASFIVKVKEEGETHLTGMRAEEDIKDKKEEIVKIGKKVTKSAMQRIAPPGPRKGRGFADRFRRRICARRRGQYRDGRSDRRIEYRDHPGEAAADHRGRRGNFHGLLPEKGRYRRDHHADLEKGRDLQAGRRPARNLPQDASRRSADGADGLPPARRNVLRCAPVRPLAGRTPEIQHQNGPAGARPPERSASRGRTILSRS